MISPCTVYNVHIEGKIIILKIDKKHCEREVEETRCFVNDPSSDFLSFCPWKISGSPSLFKVAQNWANISCHRYLPPEIETHLRRIRARTGKIVRCQAGPQISATNYFRPGIDFELKTVTRC